VLPPIDERGGNNIIIIIIIIIITMQHISDNANVLT